MSAALDASIADDLLAIFRRFISVGEAELAVLSLWTLHAHAFPGGSSFTPYLNITSAEKGSGKTRVLEVLHGLVREPLMTASISPAALARTVDKEKPTMLLDELDALLKGDKDLAEAVRGILNSGFHLRGSFTRMVGQGAAMQPQHFSTFCPKALAGIGALPDTVAARSLTLRLERSPRGTCESFRPDGLGRGPKALRQELDRLKNRASEWAVQHLEVLANAEPECPPEFMDRQRDIAEPLLAIADVLGGEWPTQARHALLALFTHPAAEDTSIGVRLLSDIKEIFDALNMDKFTSVELVEKLAEIETAPWGEWRRGKCLTVRDLARELKRFGIVPRTIRLDSMTAKGYLRESFLDPWTRYVTPRDGSCYGSKSGAGPIVYAGCDGATDKKGAKGEAVNA